MKYKIIVDKQPKSNPSKEKKEYEIDIEELRVKGDVCDSLIITKDEDYVMRRLSLSEYKVLTELEEPRKEILPSLNIELFEGDNYIYLIDMTGNKFYAEYLVKNDFTDTYVTKSEMNSSIEQKAGQIELSVTKELLNYTETTKLGTWITQNWEYIRIAWNQISEFIQLMVLNENATLAILDKNNNIMMSLDKEGQHFYKDNNTVLGEMGVKKVSEQNYISFSLPLDYGNATQEGMAWGVTTTSDGKFWPILYIKNFTMPPKNSDGCTGELVLDNCDLILGSTGAGISTGSIKIFGEPTTGSVCFEDVNSGKIIFEVGKDLVGNFMINMLENISFYSNMAGSHSFRIGNEKYCLLTDDGTAMADKIGITSNGEDTNMIGDMNFSAIPKYQGEFLVYGERGHKYFLSWVGSQLDFWVDTTNVGTLSDKRLKKEIKDIDEDFIKAIKEIEMKQFKVANRNGLITFGILAQDLIDIFEKYNKNPFDYEIVYKTQYRTDDETIYYGINYEQFLILKTKVQELEIKELQEKENQKDKIIQDLLKRVEKIEGRIANGNT